MLITGDADRLNQQIKALDSTSRRKLAKIFRKWADYIDATTAKPSKILKVNLPRKIDGFQNN